MAKFKDGDRVKIPTRKSYGDIQDFKKELEGYKYDYLIVCENRYKDNIGVIGENEYFIACNAFYENDLELYDNPIPEKWCVLQDRKEVNDWFNENSQSVLSNYSNTKSTVYLHYPALHGYHLYFSIQEHYKLITYEQFKAITNQMKEKKIIGYKLLKDVADTDAGTIGKIKKDGTVSFNSNDYWTELSDDYTGDSLYTERFCKERKDWFEPVYEPTETILRLGDKNIEVKIGKGYIQADGKEFNPEHLEELFQSLTAISTLNGYSVEVTGVKVGCTTFLPEQLNEILTTYKELNNE